MTEPPAQEEANWHSSLDDSPAFTADIELRAVRLLDNGDLGPVSGAKYPDTETGTVFIGDGSNWRKTTNGSTNWKTASKRGSLRSKRPMMRTDRRSRATNTRNEHS